MNKILSILAICAIFGVASAALADPKTLLSNDDIAQNFTGTLHYARCPKDSQLAIFSTALKSDAPTTLNITRRIVDSKTFATSNDINDTNFVKTFAGSKGTYLVASSQDGYVGIATSNGSFVSVTIFQATANLSDDKSYQVADAVLNCSTTDSITPIDFYFQDDYFYVVGKVFTTDATTKAETITNLYIQGVKAKDGKTLATAESKINKDNLSKGKVQLNCATVPGSGKPAICTYDFDNKGAAYSKNLTLKDAAAIDEVTVLTLAGATDAFSGILAFPTKEGVAFVIASVVGDQLAYTASYNGAVGVPITSSIAGFPVGGAYYYDQYFLLSTNTSAATPPVTSLFYTTFNTSNNLAANATLTNVTVDTVKYAGQFIHSDQTFYVIYKNNNATDKTVFIGKLFDKISDKKSATILKSAIASIFVAAALLFAF